MFCDVGMIKSDLILKLISIILFFLLSAAQCQPSPVEPTSTPPPAPAQSQPTLSLYPPIEPGDGSDLIDHLLETGVIRVGIHVWPEANFSPPAFRGFSNAETGGALNGFEVDIAWLIAEALGLELELVQAYPPVIASGDWRGQWDIALASIVPFDQPLAESRATLFYSRPYAYMPMGVLVRSDENNIQTLNDLSGKRVGFLEHSPYQRLLTPNGQTLTINQQPLLPEIPADIQVVPLSNLPKAIRQLDQTGAKDEPAVAVDAIFGPAPILEEAVKSELPVKLAPQAENLGLQPLVVAAVPRDDLQVDRLIQEINQALDRLERQGTLAEIHLRWYGQDLSQSHPQAAPLDDQGGQE